MTTTTETQTPEQTTDATTATPSLGELSFADYVAARRTGEMPEAEAKSAPASNKTEKAEPKQSTESDTEETEANSEEQADAETDKETEEADGEEKDKPKKSKGGFQRRVEKLTKAKAEAQREAEYWKREALKHGATDTKTEPAKTTQATKADDGKPKPEAFDSHAEYVEALTEWKTDQKLKAHAEEQRRKALETEQEQLITAHSKRVQAFAEKTEDWDEALAEVEDIQLSPALQQILVTSENGPELIYALAKERAELERIVKLPPIAAARALGAFEAKLSAKAAEAAKPKETKKLTQAPKPIEPVGGNKGAVAKSIADPDLSFADYVKLRREQERRKRA